ncbi:MAG: nitroreductase [Syntrophales bacterium]|jgi:nitroreductase
MELRAAIEGRRSIRKFKVKEIPGKTIRDILETARWAPSWGNTQLWEFYVLTGKRLDEFREANHRSFIDGQTFPLDVPMHEVWPERLKERYAEIGKIMLTAMNVKRDDKDARNRLYEDMTLLFGAPCLIVACIPRDILVEYAMLDVGLILQTICLLAYDKGIGTCIMAMSIRNPGLLRKILSIPADRKIVMGVAMGYPDENYPLNNFERKRADISEYVKWVD